MRPCEACPGVQAEDNCLRVAPRGASCFFERKIIMDSSLLLILFLPFFCYLGTKFMSNFFIPGIVKVLEEIKKLT